MALQNTDHLLVQRSGSSYKMEASDIIPYLEAEGFGTSSVTVSATAPVGPTAGDMWWNSEDGNLYIYYQDADSTQWVPSSSETGGFVNATVGANVPANASGGDLWYSTEDARLYIYDGAVWIDASPAAAIVDGSVTTVKIANDAVTADKIADGIIPDQLAVSVKDYGAVGDGTTDDTAAIQAAIDAAHALGSRTVVSLLSDSYLVTDELFIKTNVVLKDGTIIFQPTADSKTAVNIGTRDGAYLVRVGGAENVVVDASGSTQNNVTAFNFGHVARACFISKCRAIMNNGLPPGTDRNHIGFSIHGVRPDLATSAGAYQNVMDTCSAYACKIAYYIDTDGFGESGWAPETNGNFIKSCAAYSCYTSAVYLGEGAQENHVQVRADTFGSQIGQGTTIKVVDVKGLGNIVEVDEEVGSRADTQYTVYVSGSYARYNTLKYSTQQIVTAAYEDATTGSAVGKNIGIDVSRPQHLNGGDTFTVSGYASITAGTNSTIDGFVAPAPCVLIKAAARAANTPASYTRLYFAKGGTIDTLQRLTWSSSDAAGTVKTKDNDTTSAGTIDSRFIYAAGDFCSVSCDQDASGGQLVHYTLVFKALSPAI